MKPGMEMYQRRISTKRMEAVIFQPDLPSLPTRAPEATAPIGPVGSMSNPKKVVLGMSQAIKFPRKTARPPIQGP